MASTELVSAADVGKLELVSRVDELASDTTWVLVYCGGHYMLAWSPCDGRKVRVPWDMVVDSRRRGGLVLAPNTRIQGLGQAYTLIVDSRGEETFVLYKDDAIFSTHTGSWELLTQADDEPGGTLARCMEHDAWCLLPPIPDKESGEFETVGFHVYKSVVYFIRQNLTSPREQRVLQLMKFNQEEQVWEMEGSHPIYSQAYMPLIGELFETLSGGRYMLVRQHCERCFWSGFVFVVYDLEDKQWHYHTFLPRYSDVLVCIRSNDAPRRSIAGSLPAAVWRCDIDLLRLPPLPQHLQWDRNYRKGYVYPETELYPDKSELEKMKMVSSASELGGPGETTWVCLWRDEEDYLLAWSPCDGRKMRIHDEMVLDPDCRLGLVLPPDTIIPDLGDGYGVVVDAQGEEARVTYQNRLVFSSVTNSWQELAVVDPPERTPGDIGETHVYKGTFYKMRVKGDDERALELELLRFSCEERVWEAVGSHEVYSDRYEFDPDNWYEVISGGRYMVVKQENEYGFGRILLVYDLEGRAWHYHTFERERYITVVIGNRSPYPRNDLLGKLFASVWSRDRSLLQLPYPDVTLNKIKPAIKT